MRGITILYKWLKDLNWVENKVDIRKYTFQDLIDVIDEYRELK